MGATDISRQRRIEALIARGLDDAAIACRLLCDVRVVMRVRAARAAPADSMPQEGGGAQLPAARQPRTERLDWGRGRMIEVPADEA